MRLLKFKIWVAVGVVAGAATASTIIPHSLADRARASDRVVVAQVISSRTETSGPLFRPTLKTLTQVRVLDNVLGRGPSALTIVQLGGRAGPWEMTIPGDATFTVRETALLFLRCPAPTRCFLVSLGEGRLPVVQQEVLYQDLERRTWEKRPLKVVIQELQAQLSRRGSP